MESCETKKVLVQTPVNGGGGIKLTPPCREPPLPYKTLLNKKGGIVPLLNAEPNFSEN